MGPMANAVAVPVDWTTVVYHKAIYKGWVIVEPFGTADVCEASASWVGRSHIVARNVQSYCNNHNSSAGVRGP
jgi:hypothetical protein